MVMTLHKLTAGDGYLYLVRQVAAADSTERGRSTLADYYSGKGEAPGQWMGRGLAALSDTGRCEVSAQAREQIWTVEAGSGVSEEQMRAPSRGARPRRREVRERQTRRTARRHHRYRGGRIKDLDPQVLTIAPPPMRLGSTGNRYA